VIAALLVVIDVMALGLHLVEAVESPFANDDPSPARARVGGPEAVVPPATVAGSATSSAPQRVQPTGCLAIDSGCYPAGTVVTPDAPITPGVTTPPPSPTTPKPTPLAQANLGVPALESQVSLGLGDGSCTSIKLTVLSLGNCPAATGDGALQLNLGGSLLGD
jgi:hypothetical protein